MAKKFRIGVIGAGAIAQACHIPGYAESEKCILSAVADPEKRCLKQLRDRGWQFGKEYHDYRTMLKHEKLDAVSICTPNVYHKEMAVAAAKAGCDILLEKPVTLTIPEAKAVVKAAQAAKVRIMTGFTHRFNHLNISARKALKAGKIGKLFMLRVRFAHTGPWPGWARTDWFYRPELAGGGAMLDMAIHAFDLIHWYHQPVSAVQARVVTLRKKIKVDDNAVALLEFGKDCLGYVEVSWTSPSGFAGVELMGDKGSIVVDYRKQSTILTSGISSPSGKIEMKETALTDKEAGDPWREEMRHFISGLGSRKSYATGMDDGIAALKVALACYKSSREGKRVVVKC